MNVLLGHDIKLSIALKIQERTFGKVTFSELLKTNDDHSNANKDENTEKSQTPLDTGIVLNDIA